MAVSPLFLSSLLLLAVANALLVASTMKPNNNNNNNNNNALLASLGAGGVCGGSNIIWSKNNKYNHISQGGGIRNRNSSLRKQQQQQQQQQLQERQRRRQQSSFFSAASDSEDPADYDEYTPNVFPKEEEERLFIKDVLKANFLFRDLSGKTNPENPDLSEIVASFEKHTYDEGTLLCKQGDTEDTDYLYLIVSGSCSVSIDGKVLPDPYGTMGSGSLIGDLAMLYGTARAATVRTETPVTVFRLHQANFYHFLDYAAADRDNTPRKEKIQRHIKEIDGILDQISGVKSKYHGNIIRPFQPGRRWLWGQWRGTILQHAWKPALANMAMSLLFITFLRLANDHIFKNPITWPVGKY